MDIYIILYIYKGVHVFSFFFFKYGRLKEMALVYVDGPFTMTGNSFLGIKQSWLNAQMME